MSKYLEMLSLFGVGGAHPGGLAFSKAVLTKAAPPPGEPILDAGCGTGQTAAYLGHLLYPVTCVDKDPLMLEKAAKHFKERFRQYNCNNNEYSGTLPCNHQGALLPFSNDSNSYCSPFRI